MSLASSSPGRRLGALLLSGSFALASITAPSLVRAQGRNARAALAPSPIVLHRPATVGQRVHLIAEGTSDSTVQVRVGSQVVQDTHAIRHVELEADVTALAIDANGKPTEERLVVVRLVQSIDGGAATEVLPRGTIVEVRRSGPTRPEAELLVGGAPASEEVAQALDAVVSSSTSPETEDQLFGSPTPRRPGESWAANGPLLSSSLRAEAGIDSTLTGRTTFVGPQRVEDVDCGVVDVHVQGPLSALPDMPEGATIRSGRLDLTFHGAYPSDTSLPVVDGSMRMELSVVVAIDAGGRAGTLQMRVLNERHDRMRPIR